MEKVIAKKSGGMTAAKRQKAVERFLKSNEKMSRREEFGKLYVDNIDGEKKQFALSWWFVLALNEKHFVNIEVSEKKAFNFRRLMPTNPDEYMEVSYDIDDIKKEFKKWKEVEKTKPKEERTGSCILKLEFGESVGFNQKWFITLHDLLSGDGEVKFFQNKKVFGNSYFENNVGIAVLCPCKILERG